MSSRRAPWDAPLRRWWAAIAAGLLAACNTGFISMGKDDPAAAPAEPMCTDSDCGEFPHEQAMCELDEMGSYECAPNDADPLACAWHPVCHQVACLPSECGEQPPGLMCAGGMLVDYECRFDTTAGCTWRRPSCPS